MGLPPSRESLQKRTGPPPRSAIRPYIASKEQAIKMATEISKFYSPQQELLLAVPSEHEREWQGMPEYVSKDKDPYMTIMVHLRNWDDAVELGKLLGSTVSVETKYLWFPRLERKVLKDKRYSDDGKETFECPACGKERNKQTEHDYCDNPNCTESIPL